jgi:hypothetical protein
LAGGEDQPGEDVEGGLERPLLTSPEGRNKASVINFKALAEKVRVVELLLMKEQVKNAGDKMYVDGTKRRSLPSGKGEGGLGQIKC